MSDTPEPIYPLIGDFVRGVGTLEKVLDLTPPAPAKVTAYIFSEITSLVEMIVCGDKIREIESTNDFYGKSTSVENSVKWAKSYAEKHKLCASSQVEVRAVKIVTHYFKAPQSSCRPNFYDEKFVGFEHDMNRREREHLPPETKEIAWTSKSIEP